MEVVGWLGSVMLAICAIPEAYRSYKLKRCDIGWGFLLLWYIGEIFALIYNIFSLGYNPLVWNYVANITFISIMIYYKIMTKKGEELKKLELELEEAKGAAWAAAAYSAAAYSAAAESASTESAARSADSAAAAAAWSVAYSTNNKQEEIEAQIRLILEQLGAKRYEKK